MRFLATGAGFGASTFFSTFFSTILASGFGVADSDVSIKEWDWCCFL